MRKILALLVLCAVARFSLAAVIPADAASNGKTIDAKVGDVIEIKLDGNPTTGYSWATTKLEGESIKQSGEPQYKQANNDGRVGGGGTFTFAFTAEKTGQSTLNLGYARPWERVEPIQKFTLTVKVDEDEIKKIEKAAAAVRAIGNALEAFKIDTGRYPAPAEGLDVLVKNTSNIAGWHGPYIIYHPDPWANDYQYQIPGKHNPKGYDVLSAGPDGKLDTQDDIFNK